MGKLTIEKLKEFGYKEFPVKTLINQKADRFFQKKISMPDGGELFIDAFIYDFSKYSGKTSNAGDLQFSFSSQINSDSRYTTFNVETVGWGEEDDILFRVEAFFIDLYEFGLQHSKLKERH